MRLTTKRLILRDINLKDAGDIAKEANNLKVSRYLLLLPHPYLLKDAKWFINKCKKDTKQKPRKSYEFGIELKKEKKVIGMVGLCSIDKYQGTATLGLWLGQDYWRKGIATEALKKIISFAFNKLRLRRLEAGVFTENNPSYSMIEKLGFKLEGTKIKSRKAKATGKIHDEKIYALLK